MQMRGSAHGSQVRLKARPAAGLNATRLPAFALSVECLRPPRSRIGARAGQLRKSLPAIGQLPPTRVLRCARHRPSRSPRMCANTEGHVDALNLLVYCDDSASPDGLNAAEAKCADTVAKTLSNFAAQKLKCLSKCRADEHKGKVAAGSCTPPSSDLKASGCIAKNTTKAEALIDQKCEATVAPKANKPECYGTHDG